MSKLNKMNILIKMTGSISCYKVCGLISELVQSNFNVRVAASESALKFVGKASMEGLTGQSVFDDLYKDGQMMSHIQLMRWADIVLVAPATANFINKAACGIADDLISSLFLAHDFKIPYLIAPAMNSSMLSHPITQSSIKKLNSLGIEFFETGVGHLACGEFGHGRLIETSKIFERIKKLSLDLPSKVKSVIQPISERAKFKILVTAGGTEIPIDSVRSIVNCSTGETGAHIATELNRMGFDVTLLHNYKGILPNKPSPDPSENSFTVINFRTFHELKKLIDDCFKSKTFTHVIHAAAVSDYDIDEILVNDQSVDFDLERQNKISSDLKLQIKFKATEKLIGLFKKESKQTDLVLIGFKLTSSASSDERLAAIQKLFENSNSNFIVQNDSSEIDKSRNKHNYSIYKNSKNLNDSNLVSKGENREKLIYDISEIILQSDFQNNVQGEIL